MNKYVHNVGSRKKKLLYFFLESRCLLKFKTLNHKTFIKKNRRKNHSVHNINYIYNFFFLLFVFVGSLLFTVYLL